MENTETKNEIVEVKTETKEVLKKELQFVPDRKIVKEDVSISYRRSLATIFAGIQNRFWLTLTKGRGAVFVSLVDSRYGTGVGGECILGEKEKYFFKPARDWQNSNDSKEWNVFVWELIGCVVWWLNNRNRDDFNLSDMVARYLRIRIPCEADFYCYECSWAIEKDEKWITIKVTNVKETAIWRVPLWCEELIEPALNEGLANAYENRADEEYFLRPSNPFWDFIPRQRYAPCRPLNNFHSYFLTALNRKINEKFGFRRVFEGKKPTKIAIEKTINLLANASYRDSYHCPDITFEISTVHNGERLLWTACVSNKEIGDKIGELLLDFCESVGKPRVFQIRRWVKKIEKMFRINGFRRPCFWVIKYPF